MKKVSKRSDKVTSFADYMAKFFPRTKRAEVENADPYRFGQSLAKEALARNKHLLVAK
jgi:hypothetical protein